MLYEVITIGGISLIRAAAKNFNDVVIVPSQSQYANLQKILVEFDGVTTLDERKQFAASYNFV